MCIDLWVKGEPFEHKSAPPMGQWVGSAFEPKYNAHFLPGGPFPARKRPKIGFISSL